MSPAVFETIHVNVSSSSCALPFLPHNLMCFILRTQDKGAAWGTRCHTEEVPHAVPTPVSSTTIHAASELYMNVHGARACCCRHCMTPAAEAS